MERTPITIKNPEATAANQAEITATIIRNAASGLSVYQDGTLTPFAGYSESAHGALLNTILELDESSQVEVVERVAMPLESIARNLGIKAIFTGNGDLPPHIALQPIKLAGFETDNLAKKIKDISEDRNIARVSNALSGRNITFDTLVIGGNIYICSSLVSPEAYKGRRIIRRMVTGGKGAIESYSPGNPQNTTSNEPSLNPVNYDNIVHISVGRITGETTPEQLRAFYEQASSLQAELTSNPISVTSTGMYTGSSLSYFQKYVPHLITKT